MDENVKGFRSFLVLVGFAFTRLVLLVLFAIPLNISYNETPQIHIPDKKWNAKKYSIFLHYTQNSERYI